MTIGDRIKQARLDAEMTQAELARKVGVSREAVSQWESGESKGMKPENLIKCAVTLQVRPEYLVTGVDNLTYITATALAAERRKLEGSPVEPRSDLYSEAMDFALMHYTSVAQDPANEESLKDEESRRHIFDKCYEAYFDEDTKKLPTKAILRLVS